jgi:pentatricopeptide repeat domain-containing protein 1
MRRVRNGSRPLRLWAVMYLSGLVPDVSTYNTAVGAYRKDAQWQRAMQLSGLVPDVVTSMRRVRSGSRPLRLWVKMQLSGLVPDVIIYNAAVSACGKGAQWQQALDLLVWMQQSGLVPEVITYNAAESDHEEGAQWLQALSSLGCDAAVWSSVRCHHLQGCCACL